MVRTVATEWPVRHRHLRLASHDHYGQAREWDVQYSKWSWLNRGKWRWWTGRRGTVDLVELMALYGATGAELVAFDMQLNEGQKPMLPADVKTSCGK